MKISPLVVHSIDTNYVDIDACWLWSSSDIWTQEYSSILTQPVSIEAVGLNDLRFKTDTTTIVIRKASEPDSEVVWSGETELFPEPDNGSGVAGDEVQHYTGIIDAHPPAITEPGDGSIYIASCNVALNTQPDHTGETKTFLVNGTALVPTDGITQYIAIKYNNGNPIYYLENDSTRLNASDTAAVSAIWRVGTEIHSVSFDSRGIGLPNKTALMLTSTRPYSIAYGQSLTVSETSTPTPRTVVVTSALVFAGIDAQLVAAFNSSLANHRLTKVYRTAGVWYYDSSSSVYDNTHYDNGTSMVVMTNSSKYSTRWIYRTIGDDTQVFYVLGNEYNNIANAQTEAQPTGIPGVVQNHAVLVARIIIQYNAVSGLVENVSTTTFTSASVNTHNNLNGLQGTGPDYNHLNATQLALVNGGPYLPVNNPTYTGSIYGNGSLIWRADAANHFFSQYGIVTEFGIRDLNSNGTVLNYPLVIYKGVAGEVQIGYSGGLRPIRLGGVVKNDALAGTGNRALVTSANGTISFQDAATFRTTIGAAAATHNHDGTYLRLDGVGAMTGTMTSLSILPALNNTYSLGSTTFKFSELHASVIQSVGIKTDLAGVVTSGLLLPSSSFGPDIGENTTRWNRVWAKDITINGFSTTPTSIDIGNGYRINMAGYLSSQPQMNWPPNYSTSVVAGDMMWDGTRLKIGDGTVQRTIAYTTDSVTGQLLTGYVVGANTPIAATDSILQAFQKTQGQINARASTTDLANYLPVNNPTYTGSIYGNGSFVWRASALLNYFSVQGDTTDWYVRSLNDDGSVQSWPLAIARAAGGSIRIGYSGDIRPITLGGVVTNPALAGTGTRPMVASSTGVLAVQDYATFRTTIGAVSRSGDTMTGNLNNETSWVSTNGQISVGKSGQAGWYSMCRGSDGSNSGGIGWMASATESAEFRHSADGGSSYQTFQNNSVERFRIANDGTLSQSSTTFLTAVRGLQVASVLSDSLVGTGTRPVVTSASGVLGFQDATTFRTTIGAAASTDLANYLPINNPVFTGRLSGSDIKIGSSSSSGWLQLFANNTGTSTFNIDFVGGTTSSRRMTFRWSDTLDNLNIMSSNDDGSARLDRILIPRSSSLPVTINNGLTSTSVFRAYTTASASDFQWTPAAGEGISIFGSVSALNDGTGYHSHVLSSQDSEATARTLGSLTFGQKVSGKSGNYPGLKANIYSKTIGAGGSVGGFGGKIVVAARADNAATTNDVVEFDSATINTYSGVSLKFNNTTVIDASRNGSFVNLTSSSCAGSGTRPVVVSSTGLVSAQDAATFLTTIGAAPAVHSHSYLPINNPAFTGTLSGPNIDVGNNGRIQGLMADNDQWRVLGGNTGTNSGYLEIATADDGTEPIYFRQYTGVFGTLVRSLTLLNSVGDSVFPGAITSAGDWIQATGSNSQGRFKSQFAGNKASYLGNWSANNWWGMGSDGVTTGSKGVVKFGQCDGDGVYVAGGVKFAVLGDLQATQTVYANNAEIGSITSSGQPLIVRAGTYNGLATAPGAVYISCDNSTNPRIELCDGTRNWTMDSWSGGLRFFVDGSVKVTLTANSGAWIAGVTDGSTVISGNIGQVIESRVNLVAMPAINTIASIAQITLTPGRWDVMGHLSSGISTDGQYWADLFAWVGTTTASMPNRGTVSVCTLYKHQAGVNSTQTLSITPLRYDVSVNTTVYLLTQWGTSSASALLGGSGCIRAVRVG